MELFHQYLIFCLILIIGYAYAIIFAVKTTGETDGWKGSVNTVHESCLLGCNNDMGLSNLSLRGKNYIIAGDPAVNERIQNCAVTFWGGAHFLMYSCIGFFCPDLFLPAFAVGVAFETWEYSVMDCHDTLDIFLNTAGFLAGKTLHKYAYGTSHFRGGEKNITGGAFNDLF